jgi:uncharacterized membrane protein YdjX (TVP38/TMEM64 family)
MRMPSHLRAPVRRCEALMRDSDTLTLLDALVAIGMMVFATATPFPAEVAALAVAVKHALLPAIALIWTGAMLGAMLAYWLARICRDRAPWIGRIRGVRMAQERLNGLDWLGILGLRLIPLVPFFALSLAAGLLQTPPRAFLQGTALGILPATLVIALIGKGLLSDRAAFVAAAIFGLLALVVLALAIRSRRRSERRGGRSWRWVGTKKDSP